MKLEEYPQAISAAKIKLLEAAKEVRDIQKWLDQETASIYFAVAFDSELRNEDQRKAKRSQLLQQDDIMEISTRLDRAEDSVTLLEVELQLLLDEFAVAKLERRDAIALTELQALST